MGKNQPELPFIRLTIWVWKKDKWSYVTVFVDIYKLLVNIVTMEAQSTISYDSNSDCLSNEHIPLGIFLIKYLFFILMCKNIFSNYFLVCFWIRNLSVASSRKPNQIGLRMKHNLIYVPSNKKFYWLQAQFHLHVSDVMETGLLIAVLSLCPPCVWTVTSQVHLLRGGRRWVKPHNFTSPSPKEEKASILEAPVKKGRNSCPGSPSKCLLRVH